MYIIDASHDFLFYPYCRMVSFGLEDFAERYGTLKPYQFVDVVALMGDQSDNIPGLSIFFSLEFFISIL